MILNKLKVTEDEELSRTCDHEQIQSMTISVAVYFWSWTNNWKYDWVWTVSLTCDHERSEGIAMGNEEFENYIVLHCLSMCMMILKLYCINIVNWNSFKAVFQAWITQHKNIG